MSHDEYTKLFIYMEKRFDKLETAMATKADKADISRIYGAIDAFLKRFDTIEAEQAALAHQVNRHERWHHQIADKTRTKLLYE